MRLISCICEDAMRRARGEPWAREQGRAQGDEQAISSTVVRAPPEAGPLRDLEHIPACSGPGLCSRSRVELNEAKLLTPTP